MNERPYRVLNICMAETHIIESYVSKRNISVKLWCLSTIEYSKIRKKYFDGSISMCLFSCSSNNIAYLLHLFYELENFIRQYVAILRLLQETIILARVFARSTYISNTPWLTAWCSCPKNFRSYTGSLLVACINVVKIIIYNLILCLIVFVATIKIYLFI